MYDKKWEKQLTKGNDKCNFYISWDPQNFSLYLTLFLGLTNFSFSSLPNLLLLSIFIPHTQFHFQFYYTLSVQPNKPWVCLDVKKVMEGKGKWKWIKGYLVIYIYHGTHKFSLSISHFSLSHHYPYFPSLTLSISNSLLSFTQPNTLIEFINNFFYHVQIQFNS